ncbi:MAG: cytochrome ubiquinol oxidase subunit I [Candidatus Marsarchaeota archaeon]|nr:cytochrome ubiquinol oxidase subunit I [Candidatus Marsarchaeota archaeon]MCL5106097.1 cytochrome ubiquinol oxidase subunit I [Candidatus Marsarchaeota archaeon]
MALTLRVHIIFASLRITVPGIIIIAEVIGAKTRDMHYIVFAKRLAIAFVVLFAIGAASGTVVALVL